MEELEIKELENEMTEINSQINALYGKLREKGNRLSQLRAKQSSEEFRKFFENKVGKYIKVHHYIIEDDDEYKEYGIDKYFVGLVGTLTLDSENNAFVVPIKYCISFDARYDIIEKEDYWEITEDNFNSDEFSFEIITKEEANQFILDNTPGFD